MHVGVLNKLPKRNVTHGMTVIKLQNMYWRMFFIFLLVAHTFGFWGCVHFFDISWPVNREGHKNTVCRVRSKSKLTVMKHVTFCLEKIWEEKSWMECKGGNQIVKTHGARRVMFSDPLIQRTCHSSGLSADQKLVNNWMQNIDFLWKNIPLTFRWLKINVWPQHFFSEHETQ